MAGFRKGMVSMELDDESKLDAMPYTMATGDPVKPDFPYGLCIALGEAELKKLGLDIKDAQVGDELEFRAVAKVRSTTESNHENGDYCCRAELQIEKMALED
jgi:hypothetical protein